jgi:hypothetical protein
VFDGGIAPVRQMIVNRPDLCGFAVNLGQEAINLERSGQNHLGDLLTQNQSLSGLCATSSTLVHAAEPLDQAGHASLRIIS